MGKKSDVTRQQIESKDFTIQLLAGAVHRLTKENEELRHVVGELTIEREQSRLYRKRIEEATKQC